MLGGGGGGGGGRISAAGLGDLLLLTVCAGGRLFCFLGMKQRGILMGEWLT